MFKNMLSDGQDVSTMRVMSFISLLVGATIGILGICLDKDLSTVAILASVFVGASFGGKIFQKSIEVKNKEE